MHGSFLGKLGSGCGLLFLGSSADLCFPQEGDGVAAGSDETNLVHFKTPSHTISFRFMDD